MTFEEWIAKQTEYSPRTGYGYQLAKNAWMAAFTTGTQAQREAIAHEFGHTLVITPSMIRTAPLATEET